MALIGNAVDRRRWIDKGHVSHRVRRSRLETRSCRAMMLSLEATGYC